MELRTADGRQVARGVRMACSFTSRWSGRFRRVPSNGQERVLLIPCRSVHTIGMRFTIDVVFLTRQMKIIGLAPAIPPWRFKLAPAGTRWILQLAAGQIAAAGLTVGTYVVVESSLDDVPVHHATALRDTQRVSRLPCARSPMQFSLRLPIERQCRDAVAGKSAQGRGSTGLG